MRIAVTGASGFVGGHVVAELDRRGLSPILVRRQGTKATAEGSDHQVVALDFEAPGTDSFETIGSPDALIHLAWGGLPNYNSPAHFEVQLPAHYRFLKALIVAGLRNLVVAGTCLEYGMQPGALHEGLEPRPSTPYGYAKNALRIQLEFLQREVPFNLVWARLFYLFGHGQHETSLFPQLLGAVGRGEATFNMSGGEQLRDYLHVSEAARLLVDLCVSERNAGIVNVSSGQPISVRRLVERWADENGWTIGLNFGHYPYPEYEPMAFWGDRSKLDRCLDGRRT